MVGPLRLRTRTNPRGHVFDKLERNSCLSFLFSKRKTCNARYDTASSLYDLARNESSLSTANTSRVAQLRRSLNYNLRSLAREL
jgi:hypothetical protein